MDEFTFSVKYHFSRRDRKYYTFLCNCFGNIVSVCDFILFPDSHLLFLSVLYPGRYEKTIRTCLAAHKLNPKVNIWISEIKD